MKPYQLSFIGLCLFFSTALMAQTDTTKTEEFNFDEFGDADASSTKAFCTQKVSYLSPTKLISVGYEAQLPFHWSKVGDKVVSSTHVNSFRGLRLAFNTPVVSRSNFILNLGLNYWNTSVNLANPERSPLFGRLEDGLRMTSLNATAFKPLNSKHFLIFQGQADLNGNYRSLDQISGKAMTYSGAAIFGWKKNDNFMWGVGITRTYRAGQVLHIPAILYNRTFNQKWGVEALLPARLNVRRNFGPTSYLMAGFEIEGNAYYLTPKNANEPDWFLRRGEMKPRITYERQLGGFIWLSAQVGWRYNWRFDVFNTQNPVANQRPVFENGLGNPLYFNIGINLVSP